MIFRHLERLYHNHVAINWDLLCPRPQQNNIGHIITKSLHRSHSLFYYACIFITLASETDALAAGSQGPGCNKYIEIWMTKIRFVQEGIAQMPFGQPVKRAIRCCSNLQRAAGGQRKIFQKGNLSTQFPDWQMAPPMPGMGHGPPLGTLGKQHLKWSSGRHEVGRGSGKLIGVSVFKICLLIDDVAIEATAILIAHVVNKTVGCKAADNAPLLCNDSKFDFSLSFCGK